MRSRAAILPYPGDPFLLHYWLGLFDRVWGSEVDKLYIICNTPVEKGVVDYIRLICTGDKIDFTYLDHHIQHGDAIRLALEKTTEEYIMLIEDDAFVFKPGMVDECFGKIESDGFDIVGSKRGSCHPEISERAKQIWGIPTDGIGDQGSNFWPCYFFSRRELLLQTDRDYNSRAWVQGDKIVPLQQYEVVAPVIASDTFVWASLQLRAMISENRICYVPQYQAHPDDTKHFEQRAEYTPFDGKASWTHIGSLSSGASGAIMDDQGRSIAKRLIEPPHGPTVLPSAWCDVTSEMQVMEWERRVQWWLTSWEHRDLEQIREFAELYKKGLDQLITQFKLNPKRIQQRQRIYKEAFGL